MVKLTNPLNKDGILYEKGAILTLSLKDETELIANGLAKNYPLVKADHGQRHENKTIDSCEEAEEVVLDKQEEQEEVKEVIPDKVEEQEAIKTENKETKVEEVKEVKEVKNTSTRIGRTSKK